MPAIGSIFRSYNALLDSSAGRDGLEALVLVHQDAEIVDARLLRDRSARRSATREVGLVGCVGAVGVRSIAWWEASVTLRLVHQPLRGARRRRPAVVLVGVGGGTRLRAGRRGGDARRVRARRSRPGWCENVRFDESLGEFHGYDLDFCLQVRAAGRKVAHRRLPGHPPPPARDGPRPRGVDRRARQAWPTSGTGGWASAPAPGAGRSGPCGPRPRPTPRGCSAYMNAARARRPGASSSSERSTRPPTSISWRMTAPLRWLSAAPPRRQLTRRTCAPAARRDAGARRRRASSLIAFGVIDQRGGGLRAATPSPGSGSAAEPDSEVLRVRRGRARRPDLQPDPRRRRQARGPRGARARPPPHRDHRSRALRQGPARRLQRPGGRAWSGAPAPPGCGASPGGRGRSSRRELVQRYEEFGGGELPAFSWTERARRRRPRSRRWTASCSSSRPGRCATCASTSRCVLSYGFDLDFCLQVRAAGRRIVVADLRADLPPLDRARPRSRRLGRGAHPTWRRSGIGSLHGPSPTTRSWKRRARVAEAEREAARAFAFSKSLKLDAQVLELEREPGREDRQPVLAADRAAARAQPDAPAGA